jgi:hypothetical protein
MTRFSFLVLVLLLAASAVAASSAQESQPAPLAADSERPMSIFNDKVRRFKFELEEIPVTAETAGDFMASYQGHNRPAIIGAYADGDTNSLVVICAPEAEEAVRLHLAGWTVNYWGLTSPSLKVKKRGLEFRRRTLLAEMAELDVALIEAAAEAEAEAAKIVQLQARLAAFKDQLSIVERQIATVNGYIERQQTSTLSSAQASVTP